MRPLITWVVSEWVVSVIGVAIEDQPKLVSSTYMDPCLLIWTEGCGTCKPMGASCVTGESVPIFC